MFFILKLLETYVSHSRMGNYTKCTQSNDIIILINVLYETDV